MDGFQSEMFQVIKLEMFNFKTVFMMIKSTSKLLWSSFPSTHEIRIHVGFIGLSYLSM